MHIGTDFRRIRVEATEYGICIGTLQVHMYVYRSNIVRGKNQITSTEPDKSQPDNRAICVATNQA